VIIVHLPIRRIVKVPQFCALACRFYRQIHGRFHGVASVRWTLELADVLEVVRAIADAAGISLTGVEAKRQERVIHRGAFEKRIMLVETLENI